MPIGGKVIPIEPGTEVIVTTMGRYPHLDMEVGVVEETIRPKGGASPNFNMVYFPSFDKSYKVMTSYLTPIDTPTKGQVKRYLYKGAITLATQEPEYIDLKERERKFDKTYWEGLKNRRDALAEVSKDLGFEDPEEVRRARDLLVDIGEEPPGSSRRIIEEAGIEKRRTQRDMDVYKEYPFIEGKEWK